MGNLTGQIPNGSGAAGQILASVYNNTSSEIGIGRPVQQDNSGSVIWSVKAPGEPGLLVDFAGITTNEIKAADTGQVCSAGTVPAVVLATATTTIGSWLYPVTVGGVSYLKESKTRTYIVLNEDISANSGDYVLASVAIKYEARIGERIRHDIWRAPAAASATYVHAAANCDTSEQTITTAITNPDVPRNLTATAGGTAGDIAAVQVVVTGTNASGNTITETLPAFTLNTAGAVTGSKAFKTVTQYVVPAMDGTGCTVSIGIGDKLGLCDVVENTALIKAAFLNGTLEGTAPAITGGTGVTESEVENSTADLNSALNGTQVDVFYFA